MLMTGANLPLQNDIIDKKKKKTFDVKEIPSSVCSRNLKLSHYRKNQLVHRVS